MKNDKLSLGTDELAPVKHYMAERVEEISEINSEIASLFEEING